MAEKKIRREIEIGLLERLTDDEPRNRTEAPLTHEQALRKLKTGLRRDIEWLLNTRREIQPVPEGARYLPESVFAYGIPDLSGGQLGSERQQTEMARHIEQALTYFEPRLKHIIVTALPISGSVHMLRFQIDALLRVEPGPERIQFDTTLEVASGTYRVEGGRA